MPPPAGRVAMSLPLAATSFTASSRLKTPPIQAATYSPMLCPQAAMGFTPKASHIFASAYSILKRAGCV